MADDPKREFSHRNLYRDVRRRVVGQPNGLSETFSDGNSCMYGQDPNHARLGHHRLESEGRK